MRNVLFRSLMFVPAHNKRFMDKAQEVDADVLLFDIEDSVQPRANKQIARDNIVKYILEGKFVGRTIFPRINDRESGELLKDLYQLTLEGVTGFMYPKAMTGEDIYFVGKLLETIEYEKGFPNNTFKLIPLIETTSAIMHLNEICNACLNRVVAIAFGCEDYMTDLKGMHEVGGDSMFVARSLIAIAARAAGIIPIDTVHIRVHDLEDLERNLVISKQLGYDGMLVLNPKELPLIHKYYSPSVKQVEWAKEMLKLAEEAIKEGKGVAVKEGKFVGPPMIKMAQDIIKKQIQIEGKAK